MATKRWLFWSVVCCIAVPAYSQQGSALKPQRVAVVPPPNAAGWNNTPVNVTFECADGDVRVCPGPMTVNTDGAAQRLSRIAVDSLGTSVTLDLGISINIDRTAPRVQIASTTLLPSGSLRVAAIATDELSGVRLVACNGRAANLVNSMVTCDIPAHDGVNDIAVTAIDSAGNSASSATQVVKPATSTDVEIAPKEMTLQVGEDREVQFLDSAGHEINGGAWRIEDPSVARVEPAEGIVTATSPGETFVTASMFGQTARTKLTVIPPAANLPNGTVLWRMHAPQGMQNTFTVRPEGQADERALVFIGTQPDGFVVLRATTMSGTLVSKEYAALSPGERVVDWMADHDGGVLLWAEMGSRSAIVRTGRPSRGALWRYECASPATTYWSMPANGTLFVVEKPQTGFGDVTGIDSGTGDLKFRVAIPHTLGAHGGFGAITVPTGTDAMLLFVTTAAGQPGTSTRLARPRTDATRIHLLQISDDGSARVSPVIDFTESDPSIVGLGGVYPDGRGAIVALMRRRHADGRADGFVVRIDGDKRSSYALPAVGEYVLGEEDEALTTDHKTLVSFDVVTGQIRWTFAAPADGAIRLEYAAAGGGAVVLIAGGPQPGRYRFDRAGNPTRE